MNPLLTPLGWKATGAGLLLCAGMALAACTSDQSHEYLAHTDKVTRGAGNAVASNRAVHTIDPWSAPSHNTQINMDGKRAAVAAQRYGSNTNGNSKGSTSSNVSSEVGQK